MIRVHGRNKLGTYAEIIQVIVWFRPNCISCIFHIYYYYFLLLVFLVLAVFFLWFCCFMVVSSVGLWPFW